MKIKFGIRSKILVPVLSITILTYVISLGYISYSLYTGASIGAKISIDSKVKLQSENISNYINPKIALSKTMTHAIELSNPMPENARKQYITELLQKIYTENPNILAVWISRAKYFYDPNWKNQYGRNRLIITLDSPGKQKTIDEELNLDGDPEGSLYAKLRQSNVSTLLDPYRHDVLRNGTEILMTSIAIPVQEKGAFIGSAGIDISLSQLDALVKSSVSAEGTNAFIMTSNGNFIASSDSLFSYQKSKNIQYLVEKSHNINTTIAEAKPYSFIQKDSTGKEYYFSFQPIRFSDNIKAWSYAVSVPVDTLLLQARKTLFFTLLSGILGIIVTTIFIIIISRSFIRPIIRSSEYAQKLTEGDFTIDISSKGNDEIALMQQNLNSMKDNLSNVFKKIKNTAFVLDSKSKRLKEHSTVVNSATAMLSSASEEVSASIEEMLAGFEQNAENTEQSVRSAEKSVLRLKKTEKSVNDTADIMKQIAEKLAVIDEIAFKTKLLSINSSIEAARAGSMGKGFAVLSTEVRKLAEKVKDISEDIKTISNRAVDISDKSVILLQELIPEIQNSTKQIQAVLRSSIEQKTGAMQVNEAVAQMSVTNQKNVNMAEHIDTNSEELAVLADEMLNLVKFFRI